MPTNNCALAALTPYQASAEAPWDVDAIKHVHARLGFGVSPAVVDEALRQNPSAYVQQLVNAAAEAAPTSTPPWHDWPASRYTDTQQYADQVSELRRAWVADMRTQPLRGKLHLFWSGHFVTSLLKYQCPSWMWAYYDVLQTHAFGDFRAFVRAIGTTPAMLVYLDGVLSNRFEPNENYARELFELFTLGEGNGYTQTDISEAARALTGFNGYTEACAPIGYRPELHDPTDKTIFGVIGPHDYDALVDLIFSERAKECSAYVCTRLYRHFVSPEVDEAVVTELAATLRDSEWSLRAVYEQLFTSAHFLSPSLYGAAIKAPYEFVIGAETILASEALMAPDLTDGIAFITANLGQNLFAPPDVAGWPGDRLWVNANSLSLRYEAAQVVVFLTFQADRAGLVSWVRALDPPDERDVASVTRAVADFVLPKGLPAPTDYERATEVMRAEVPSYYFEEGIWSLDFEYAPEQIAVLLVYLLRRPEFQLN